MRRADRLPSKTVDAFPILSNELDSVQSERREIQSGSQPESEPEACSEPGRSLPADETDSGAYGLSRDEGNVRDEQRAVGIDGDRLDEERRIAVIEVDAADEEGRGQTRKLGEKLSSGQTRT
jgi:hypothetical protein